MRNNIFFLMLFFVSSVFAEDIIVPAEIVPVENEIKTLTLKVDPINKPSIGEKIIAAFDDGSKCQGEIVSSKGEHISIVTRGCLVGLLDTQKKEVPIPKESVAPATKPKVENKYKYSLNIFGQYSGARTIKSEGSYLAIPYEGTRKSNGAFGLGAELMLRRNKSFGFSGGFSYDLPRDIDSVHLNTSEAFAAIIYTGANPSFGVSTFYLNLNYSFTENFFAYAGVNYSLFYHETVAGDDTEFHEGLGGQLGIGYQIAKNCIIDIGYRFIRGDITYTDTPGVEEDFRFNGVIAKLSFSLPNFLSFSGNSASAHATMQAATQAGQAASQAASAAANHIMMAPAF